MPMLNTVIFDMDGLLINSEPLWKEAGVETLNQFNVSLTQQQYDSTTGLRTREWIDYWFRYFKIDMQYAEKAIALVNELAAEKIKRHADALPGIRHIFHFFHQRRFSIGIASSSPLALINVVTQKIQIDDWVTAKSSAEQLAYGKPHPEVFLNCAGLLRAAPFNCLVFEDSFNGLLAAKAARMKCVVVPAAHEQQHTKWSLADLKLSSLQNFNDLLLQRLERN
jgi:mannitol-1-/sugar-/sorbitol-6-/2-deoxyglucose-6-phosphatase